MEWQQREAAPVDLKTLQAVLEASYSAKGLSIQRLSGPPLSMKQCYINLAVIEKSDKTKENLEEKSKTDEVAKNVFHRLPSFEAVDSNKQKLVPLEALFNERALAGKGKAAPKRILIRGRAGIGKTTLSKKIVYEYTQQGRWQDRFEWLLRIPLRSLKGKSSCDLKTLFYNTYFHGHPKGQDLSETLAAHVNGPAKDKTLFILDGWDEVAQEWGEGTPMSGFLQDLLDRPAVLITSRPHVDVKSAHPMDLELETVGFSPENVTAYLDNKSIVAEQDAVEIKRLIQNNSLVQGLINVPIQLDALCYSWDEVKQTQKGTEGTITITALYQAMMMKLWRKDVLRLEKQAEGRPLTEEEVKALRNPLRVEQLLKSEDDFLSALAFQGLQKNQIEFNTPDLDALIGQLVQKGVSLPFTLENNLKKLSFLHSDDSDKLERERSTHFMHLTFQEYFAAHYFVRQWETEQPLLNGSTPRAFLQQEKYNPRYEVFWWFVSGLLRGQALNRFFEALESEPRDLFGAHHQRLIVHCLQEASQAPSMGKIREMLEQGLLQWLALEIDKEQWDSYSLMRRDTKLTSLPTFPEHLLLKHLKAAESKASKYAVLRAFQKRSVLSEAAIQASIDLLKDWDVRSYATDVLGKQTTLSEAALQTLIDLLKNQYQEEWYVRSSAATVLGQQTALSEPIVQALISALQDWHSTVRSSAATALACQTVDLAPI